jgi:hypothetical protein
VTEGVLTVDKLREIERQLASIPPPPVFVIHDAPPLGQFWKLEAAGRDVWLAKLATWRQFPAPRDNPIHFYPMVSPVWSGDLSTGGIRIVELSAVDADLRLEIMLKLYLSRWPGTPPQWPRDVAVTPKRMR